MAKPLKIKKVSPNDPLPDLGVRILATRLKEFYSHWPDPTEVPTYDQLHNMRISGKRLRYSAESLNKIYPDKLALLIELLKRSQDLLGEIQDCVTQGHMIEEDLKNLRQLQRRKDDVAVLEAIITDYRQRQDLLFIEFREVWRGMTRREFRDCLKMMIRGPLDGKKEADYSTFILINPY